MAIVIKNSDEVFYNSKYDENIVTPETHVVKDFYHNILWIYGQPFMRAGLSITNKSIVYDMSNSETYRQTIKKNVYCFDDFELDGSVIIKTCKKEHDLFNQTTLNSFNGSFLHDGHHMTKDNLNFRHKPFGIVINCRRSSYDKTLLICDLKIFNIDLFAECYYNNKKYVAAAYYCKYVGTNGVYQNEKYDVIQTSIFGDHLGCVSMGLPGARFIINKNVEKFIDNKGNYESDFSKDQKYSNFVDPMDEAADNTRLMRNPQDPVDPPRQQPIRMANI